jgi:hypothetical protein
VLRKVDAVLLAPAVLGARLGTNPGIKQLRNVETMIRKSEAGVALHM